MESSERPRAFVSHASEDKERFVAAFATQLRSGGVDAWYDKWEIRPGDSLVQRIFDQGIGDADAFLIVLSHVSVSKPWVREELDVGVIQRISSAGATRLIPIVLDEGVEVPLPLVHLLWLSVPELGVEGVVDEVVRVLYGQSSKPPVGPPPDYVGMSLQWVDDPVDDLVLELIIHEWRKHGLNTILYSNPVQDEAAKRGVKAETFYESMHALRERGLINADPMAGGHRWRLKPLPDRIWLRAEAERGINVEAGRRQLLALIVNEGTTRITSDLVNLHDFTVQALLRGLEGDGLLRFSRMADGSFVISKISPLARRALRD